MADPPTDEQVRAAFAVLRRIPGIEGEDSFADLARLYEPTIAPDHKEYFGTSD